MRVLVSGSTGLVGNAVIEKLKAQGHQAIRLVRKRGGHSEPEVLWNPADGKIARDGLEGLDGVIHLAGENIASERWTEEKKRRIRDSRVVGTALLSSALAGLADPPKAMVSASAIGFYGNRGDEVLGEDAAPGSGFLAEVCQGWENATEKAEKAGIRVAHVRIGVVLAQKGGALDAMLTPFKMGLGGVLGSGAQYMSWIALDDLVNVLLFALKKDKLEGPINGTTPDPVTNRDFTKTLGKVLNRPTILPVPAFGLRLLLGEMADEMLLPSVRCVPNRLNEAGFTFEYGDLEAALRHALR